MENRTTAAYFRVSNKWWPRFLLAAGMDHLIEEHFFIDDDGTPRDGVFRQLFIWLYEQPGGSTKGIFKTVATGRARSCAAVLAAWLRG